MSRIWLSPLAFGFIALCTLLATSQPPGPPRYELGKLLPPPVRRDLELTKEQEKQLAELEKEVKERLEKILTAEQKKTIENLPQRGPGGPPPQDTPPPGERRERPTVKPEDAVRNLIKNADFSKAGEDAKMPVDFLLKGDVAWVVAGNSTEFAERGIALNSHKHEGSVTQHVTGFKGGVNQWFRLTIRGLAETNFAVEKDDLYLKVDFFGNKGTNPLDGVTRKIYSLVERDRKELAENGVGRKNGAAVWKTYALEFKLPFAEIDQLRVSAGFRNGAATTDKNALFYVTQFSLVPIAPPADAPKVVKKDTGYEPSQKSLQALGGRWYYESEKAWREKPMNLKVDYANANRLYYRDNRLTNPFAENMTAWLRKGYKDLDGKLVEADRFIADNVVVEFADDKTLIVRARNIPNHPTAQFPERRGNPSYIQEHEYTYYLPLNPVRNPKAIAMDKTNSNRALPMGAIGIAINGVVFYNPFDAGMQDATDLMDRCCGHPSPDNRYHYHKYPVCVKSPFVDEGEEHSPLIGWAFDGFPIYGPYESKGVMAKDLKENPLNEFNVHYDEQRGWHYHVTPGKYPYVIGGYWGEVDTRNFPRRGPGGPRREAP